ncbi:hypothetical protein KQI42_12270 [Tissierella sp. MSJ-40]|uniref:Bacterial toxin 44 domain-containing protein n=1 Tax=Tissierella simiarum TaxID=2841534 RepID=A0ABS6E796_9FIRM|nr:hypothetical protein [Tissierella simiarum]MBU5438794.1 hypothetical protein [Tissierella simiarum]
MKFKKIFSMILVFMMVSMNFNVFASEMSLNPNIEIIESIENDGIVIKEITKIGDTYYYYEDNDNFTLSISENVNGYAEINMKDKLEPNLINSTIINDRTEDFNIENFDVLRTDVLNNKIKLDKQLSVDFNENITQPIELSTDSSIASKITADLESYYGKEYSSKYLRSLVYRGYTGKLYESMHFEMYKHYSWDVYAGMSVSAIAALVSWPTTVINTVFTIVSLGTGGYGVIKDVTANEYVSKVHYNKIVEVRNIYPYRAGKTINRRSYVGDRSAASQYKSERADYDFNDNEALLRKGIDNYIQFHQ